LFRYRVIAPLRDVREDGSLRGRITALAGERHRHPPRRDRDLGPHAVGVDRPVPTRQHR
jgi:hypothetical protein